MINPGVKDLAVYLTPVFQFSASCHDSELQRHAALDYGTAPCFACA